MNAVLSQGLKGFSAKESNAYMLHEPLLVALRPLCSRAPSFASPPLLIRPSPFSVPLQTEGHACPRTLASPGCIDASMHRCMEADTLRA